MLNLRHPPNRYKRVTRLPWRAKKPEGVFPTSSISRFSLPATRPHMGGFRRFEVGALVEGFKVFVSEGLKPQVPSSKPESKRVRNRRA
jgi:hypothetical protein